MDKEHDRSPEDERNHRPRHDNDLSNPARGDGADAAMEPQELSNTAGSYEANQLSGSTGIDGANPFSLTLGSSDSKGSYEISQANKTPEGDGPAAPDPLLEKEMRAGTVSGDSCSRSVQDDTGGELVDPADTYPLDPGPASPERQNDQYRGGKPDGSGPAPGWPTTSRKDRSTIQYDIRAEGKNGLRKGLLSTLAMVLAGAVLGSAITLGTTRLFVGGQGRPVIQSPVGKADSDRLSSIVTAPPADTGTTAENLIAEQVTPSVVGITTQTRVTSSNAGPFFFGFQGSDSVVQGVGSGVIVTEDGYILTNSHVVSNGEAEKIQVIFSDETSVAGEVLWTDATLDLAIVKADATGLTPVQIGASDLVRVGDKAIAIGNPLGMDLQSTLTSGYISGLDRSINLSDGGTMTGLIQTDAAINEGNSGGALLNSAGQLIGINTAKAGGSASGIGFAIPVDTAKPIIEKVMTEGSFQSVYLGVAGVDSQTVRAMGETLDYEGDGVYIMEIMAGTAADEAGLKVHDIMTAIDGKPFSGMTELKKILLSYEVGDRVDVTYVRNNKEGTLTLTFAQDSSNIDEYSAPPDTPPAP